MTKTRIIGQDTDLTAANIDFVPNGSIGATDVQAAIQEVRDEASGSGIPATIVDVKGDLIAATAADTVARLAAAANGAALITASGESTGLKWRLNNDAAGAAPTVNDDSGDGYSIGSRWLDTTNDKEYVALDVSAGAAVWVETTATGGGSVSAALRRMAHAYLPGHVSGRYYELPFQASGTANSALVADVLSFVPFYVPETATYDRIGINVTTAGAGGSTARLGIYASGSNGFPNALVLDAGTVSIATTGGKEITISQSLTGDTVYWLAAILSAGASLRLLADANRTPLGTTAIATTTNDAITEARAMGALPATATPAYSTPNGLPAIRLRRA